ncbi:hypothetical protein F4811DRAFT_481332 [Daldinia bambusicola]|nr:hypothetical protein F4811DRAFT_481332 [Daldinia bambusicola]
MYPLQINIWIKSDRMFSNSFKNLEVVPAELQLVSKRPPAPTTTIMAVTQSLGKEVRQALLLHGVLATTIRRTKVEAEVVALLLGVIAIAALTIMEAITTVVKVRTTAVVLPPEQHLGISLRPGSPNTPVIPAIQDMVERLVWHLLLVLLLREVLSVLLLDYHPETLML